MLFCSQNSFSRVRLRTLLLFFLTSGTSLTFPLLNDTASHRPVCQDENRGPSSPKTAMAWLKLIAWSKLPLVSHYNTDEKIVCMPDIGSYVPDLKKSGVCAVARYHTITGAEVRRGLKHLVEANCKVCGTFDGLSVMWVRDRDGCEGVCRRNEVEVVEVA